MNESSPRRLSGFSLRTLQLLIGSLGVLCAALMTPGVPAWLVHLLIVLAFVVPGGSYGYDRGGTSRSAVIWACSAAVLGTVLLSITVLAADFLR